MNSPLRSPATQAAGNRSLAGAHSLATTDSPTASRRSPATQAAGNRSLAGAHSLATTDSPTASALGVADRRRLALERLHGAAGVPERRHGLAPWNRHTGPARSRSRAAARTKVWDVHRGPSPIGYYVVAVVITLFVMLGLVMVLSASAQTQVQRGNSPYAIFNRQFMFAALGTVGLIVAVRINLVWVRRLAVPSLLLAGLGMLAPFVPGLGVTINDARAWVSLGPLSIQPSEFLKLAAVLAAADLLVRREDVLADLGRSLKPLMFLAAMAAGGCLAQRDLGSAIVITAIVLSVAFVGGVPLVPLMAAAVGAGVVAVGFVFSSSYRYDRFTAFLDIEGHRDRLSYQVWNGFLSIADGGLTGSGVGAGNSKLGYLPLAHSDFIFAVMADELGFIGSLAVIGGFGLLVWFGIQAALSASDRFGMLVAGGISAWFGVQAVVNMGGVVGLMPVTGLTLPFFSAGGTSLFVSMTAAGLLLNVAGRGR